MKYLYTFESKTDYKTAKKAHSLRVPCTCMTKEKHEIYTRPAFVEKQYAEAGDIIVYSKEAYEAWTNAESGSTAEEAAYQTLVNSTAYMRPEYFDATAAQKYIPEAIVAVPYSHTGDGTIRAMSLKYMDPANPENGTIDTETKIMWGAKVDIVGISNFNKCAAMVNPSLGVASTLASSSVAFLPSDAEAFSALEVPDSDGQYYWHSEAYSYAPCPYLSDGSLNRQYLGEYGVNSKLTNNGFVDMDGLSNTKAIINTLNKTYINSTLFADTITDAMAQTVGENITTNIFPAAMCCQRYKTVLKPNAITYDSGTDTYTYGDWYLPAAGELGYVTVNQGSIVYSLNRINSALFGTAAEWTYGFLWASSENNYQYAWYFAQDWGHAHTREKSHRGRLFAFTSF